MTFTLCVDGAPFVKEILGLDRAISAFLYICFIADLEYPQVLIIFCLWKYYHLLTAVGKSNLILCFENGNKNIYKKCLLLTYFVPVLNSIISF